MFNLIKMDLHRLSRSFSTYIMIVLAASLAFFTVYMTNHELNIVKENPPAVTETTDTDSDENTFGIVVDTNPMWISGDIDFSEMLGVQVRSDMALILVSIFVTLFVAAERKNGFIKNIAGQFHNRSIMVAAKLVAVAVQVLILFVTFVSFILVSSFIFWGDRLVLSSVSELLQIVGIQYLLHFAFACLITFLCLLSNSSAFSMTIGILLCSSLGTLVYNIIDRVISNSFRIEKYMLEVNISYIGAGVSSDVAARAIVVGISYILVTMILSMLTVQKRDIK